MVLNKLKSKNIAILGLGTHGGGVSSALFASYMQARHISIFDNANSETLNKMLIPLSSIENTISVEPYQNSHLAKQDMVIKNPAIPRTNPILNGIKNIETDISLYFQHQNPNTWMITGTKGKSSVSSALHNLLAFHSNIKSHIAGNITFSPLNLIINDEQAEHLVLELSSFQLGDLSLVTHKPFHLMEIMVLTNLLQDHLNYYSNLEEYTADKFYPFHHIANNALAILPYTKQTVAIHSDSITLNLHNNNLTLPIEQCYFHSSEVLPSKLKGAWMSAEGIYQRAQSQSSARLLIPTLDIPIHIPPQNLAIVTNVGLIKNKSSLPKNVHEWTRLFSLSHRKEMVRELDGRTFFNDSAATIPQAMQLALFSPKNILLIAGGTDKNLNPEDFIKACASASKIYLLEGTYTQKIIPLLDRSISSFSGPYTTLAEAVNSAFAESKKGDVIVMSPGCASFGMFLHEFDRGSQFINLVKQL